MSESAAWEIPLLPKRDYKNKSLHLSDRRRTPAGVNLINGVRDLHLREKACMCQGWRGRWGYHSLGCFKEACRESLHWSLMETGAGGVHRYSWCAEVEEMDASLRYHSLWQQSWRSLLEEEEMSLWSNHWYLWLSRCSLCFATCKCCFNKAQNQGKCEVRSVHLFPENTLDYLTHSLA